MKGVLEREATTRQDKEALGKMARVRVLNKERRSSQHPSLRPDGWHVIYTTILGFSRIS